MCWKFVYIMNTIANIKNTSANNKWMNFKRTFLATCASAYNLIPLNIYYMFVNNNVIILSIIMAESIKQSLYYCCLGEVQDIHHNYVFLTGIVIVCMYTLL